MREEPVTKVDRLMKEALGWDSETATYNKMKVMKVFWEDRLQLNDEKLGPDWRQTQGPDRRRSSQLMMQISRGGARADGGLVVAGVANQRNGKRSLKMILWWEESKRTGHGWLKAQFRRCAVATVVLWSTGRSCTASNGHIGDSTCR